MEGTIRWYSLLQSAGLGIVKEKINIRGEGALIGYAKSSFLGYNIHGISTSDNSTENTTRGALLV